MDVKFKESKQMFSVANAVVCVMSPDLNQEDFLHANLHEWYIDINTNKIM